jgi:hypothetical protein
MRTWSVHASVDGVGEATVVGSALAALTGREERGFEGGERHGWHKGFPVSIGIG